MPLDVKSDTFQKLAFGILEAGGIYFLCLTGGGLSWCKTTLVVQLL